MAKKNKWNNKEFSNMIFSISKKVDNHIHHAAAMSPAHLRQFMVKKSFEEANTLVLKKGDK